MQSEGQNPGESPQRSCPEKWQLTRPLKRPLHRGAGKDELEGTRARGGEGGLGSSCQALLQVSSPSPLLPATSQSVTACCSKGKAAGSRDLGVPGGGAAVEGEQEDVRAATEGWWPFLEEEGNMAGPGRLRGWDVLGRRGELWRRVWKLDIQGTVERIRWRWWPFHLLREQKSWKGQEPVCWRHRI